MYYLRFLSLAVLLMAIGFYGCASSSDGSGSGGWNGSGGARSGGQTGSGGSSATGGTSSTGGTAAPGGSSGSGGTSTGGSLGSGGSGTGGASGGSLGNGGQGSGGKSGSGGSAAGGTSGAGTGGSSAGGSSGTGGSGGSCSASADTCPAPKAGLTWNCKKRFSYGVNFAWSKDADANFGTDFGGFAAWNKKGVSAAKAARTADMTDMKNHGVDVIRWWMLPALGTTDGVKLDGDRTPTGVGGTMLEDIDAALEIAASLDLHIKLTLFSFDNFWNDMAVGNVTTMCIKPIITDDAKRAALIANVVVPIAKAVEASPNKARMISWDVINEPEWSITGEDGYGDQKFDPTTSGSSGRTMAAVTFPQMETFVKDVVAALHANSSAPVTVGGAAVKWAKAWSKVGLDYYDFHWYGWVDEWFPHTKTPTDYKVDDKPVVVGEFPLNPSSDTTGKAFGGIGYGKLIDDWFDAGYAGVQGWAFSDSSGPFSWANGKANVKTWADAHPCYTHY